MCSYCKKHDETEVPDPYYGGAQGFEKVNTNSLELNLSVVSFLLKWFNGDMI